MRHGNFRKRRIHAALCVFTCWMLASAFEQPAAAELTAIRPWAPPQLKKLISEALENNQMIQSQAAEVEALKARISSAGALPDPKIGFGLQNLPTDSYRFDQEPMTQKQVVVEQRLPWLSKLNLQSESVAHSAGQQAAALTADRLALARDVAVAWYELGYVAEIQRINQRMRDMVSRIRKNAQSRYAVGKSLQQEVFQAEVERIRLEDEAIMLENRHDAIEDRLHELLNRERYQAVTPPEDLPEPGFSITPAKLTQAAVKNNPGLKRLQAAIARTRTKTRLAKKEYYPDFNIRLSYGQREEDRNGRDLPDFFSASVMMDIPLWHQRKQAKEVAATEQKQQAAENRYLGLRRRLPYQIDALAQKIRDTRRRYRLYQNSLIPGARQWARSATDAYQVGKVSFDTMINARIRVLKYQREASRLLHQVYQIRAELEAVLGAPINENLN